MKKSFCTVCTQSHIPYALALHESLAAYDKDVVLNVLVVDGNGRPAAGNVQFFRFPDIGPLGDVLAVKYKDEPDKLRWGCKSLFLEFLLSVRKDDAVIYADSDINFFNDHSFLFDLLEEHAVILTPHWRGLAPDQKEFQLNFRDGFFNAGFMGATQRGLEAVRWWKKCCEYRLEKNFLEGSFDDQKYLDLLPFLFEDVFILRHRGCNVANWNKVLCERTKTGGQVLINGRWPVVFVHFANSLIRDIDRGGDPFLAPYYQEYKERVKKFSMIAESELEACGQ